MTEDAHKQIDEQQNEIEQLLLSIEANLDDLATSIRAAQRSMDEHFAEIRQQLNDLLKGRT